MIEYEDFDLRISADGPSFWVSAQRGSQTAGESLRLDLSRSWDLWKPQERGPGQGQALGAELFDALIRGSIRTLYDQARGQAGKDSAKGVRIRIHLEPREPRLKPFHHLPWEILFDPLSGRGKHLGLDPRMPVVRTLESAAETLLPAPDRPLRVLVALSDPRHPTKLDLEGERQKIGAALSASGSQIEDLQGVTRASLQRRIRDGHFHVFHYLGHGDFAEQGEEGVLLLEGANRSPDPLSASLFASFFEGRPMPSLVVLSACHTAAPGSGACVGPYAGVAAALIGEGLPAVLAMQTAVRDRSAIRFTERLYERLAGGDSVDEAVIEGRRELAVAWPETLDWVVPVLFVRGRAAGVIPPEDMAAKFLRDGIQLFVAGRYALSLQSFEKVRDLGGDVDNRASLYQLLCTIASTPRLPLDSLQEIDRSLQYYMSSKDHEVAGVAKLVLGIHRLDYMEPCRFRTQGIQSSQLFEELGRSRRSKLESEIALAIRASRDARALFNLT